MRQFSLVFVVSLFLLQLTCGQVFGQNFGIGTTTPSEKLHVNGNFRLDNAFMPGNNPGLLGQVLVSNGPNTAPSWKSAGQVFQPFFATATRTTINNANWKDVAGMSITLNLTAAAQVVIITTGSLESFGTGAAQSSPCDVGINVDGTIVDVSTQDILNNGSFGQVIQSWSQTYVVSLAAGAHTIKIQSRMYTTGGGFVGFYAGGTTTGAFQNQGSLVTMVY